MESYGGVCGEWGSEGEIIREFLVISHAMVRVSRTITRLILMVREAPE